MMTARARLGLFAALCAIGLPAVAEAQQADPQILAVPFAQQNPALPHPAHAGARITLKAILRNANCVSGYRVWWDTNLNGDYEDETSRDVTRTGNSVYDIGRTFQVPAAVAGQVDGRLPVGVRVRNLCTNQDAFGTFRLYVYAWTPSNDPRQWTREQLEIMGQMAVKEALWYIHRNQTSRTNQGLATLTSRLGTTNAIGPKNALGAWFFSINGHLPAYPPGTINAFNQPLPNGWAAENDRRWRDDPYSETAMGMVNDALAQGTARVAIPAGSCAAEEANTCGYNALGQEVACQRLAGTATCQGAYTGGAGNNTYYQGTQTGGLATVLPALAGTPLQVGGLAGTRWEVFVQELTDYLGYMQGDGDLGMGGWYYTATNGNLASGSSDASTSQWAYIGLESAEVAGRPFGVFVNNRHKYRIAENLGRNIQADNGAGYRSNSGRGNYQLTGGALVGARWLGLHAFNGNEPGWNAVPFPNYTTFTRAQLKGFHDRYMTYTTSNWTSTTLMGHGGSWISRLWQNGDYLCGNTNALYGAGRCGNTYAMYSHQKAYRTGTPELTLVGGRDWFQQFATYYMRAQDRNLADYATFGRVVDDYCNGTSVTCSTSYAAPWITMVMSGLTITPTIFNPRPVATAVAQPTTVVEGCSGGNNGQVTFSHNESFHPNTSARIIAYRWDVDASNGLWWQTGAPADFVTDDPAQTFLYRYQRTGNYTATLQIVDNGSPAQTDTKTVAIRVDAAPNVAPSAAAGGPYIVEVGSALQLQGTASDQNQGCGDVLATAWDVNDANTWNSAATPTGIIPWASMQALPRGQAVRLRMRVTDAAGLTAFAETTITIYAANPVASGRANPNPAACQQQVEFDGSASFHPNPQRTIATYQWDVDGQAGYEGGGANPRFTFTYARYGTYTVRLRVTDDLGRSNETTFDVNVNQGNQPPVARTSAPAYVLLEGDDLVLDGRPSSDANVACGDSIVQYAWDLNGNGQYNDPIDVQGNNPRVPWAVVRDNLQWPADRNTNLPSNTVRLRVTDTFGATGTVAVTVTIYQALPQAVVVQSPNPAPINLVTGFSTVTLDGRESGSPIPGMTLVSYDWDMGDDGQFEVINQPVREYNRVFNPVPRPDEIPDVFVRLRVTDRDGRQAITRYRIRYRVPPTPPTADADPTDPPERAYHILLGEDVVLDASQSFDPDERDFGDFIAVYRWDLGFIEGQQPVWDREIRDQNGDKQEAVLRLTAAELAAMGLDRPGVFTVLLEVEDTTQLTNRDPSTLTIYARDPVAVASANPNPTACGARVTFDGTASRHPHPDVNVVRYQWDMDANGTYDDAEGANVSRQFDQFTFGGPARVGLRVTDSNGNTATTTVDVVVDQGNRAPVSNPGGPYAIAVGDQLRLDGSASRDPDAACGDSIVRYAWDLRNDGTVEFQSPNDPRQTVTWAQLNAAGINAAGAYRVRLRVTDRFGVNTDNDVELRVLNGPTAVARAVPDRVGCNDVVTFDGTASSTDGAGLPGFDLVAYEWDLDNDGVYETNGARVQRNVVARNQVTARLRVTDAGGRTATSEVVVRVDINNVAPVANAGGPYITGRVGGAYAPVRLDARASFDPNAPCDTIDRVEWDLNRDGVFGDAVGMQVDYTNPAWQVGMVQIVRVRVRDSFEVWSVAAETEIRVQNEAPPAGDIVSPRAGADTCVGSGNVEVRFRVSDPEGDAVTATVLVGGQAAGSVQVQTRADGQPVEGMVVVNANQIPDGQRDLEIRFDDGQGGVTIVNAGGRVLFDKVAPTVTIGPQLGDNVCYSPNQVPNPVVTVQDALDANPRVDQETGAAGCGRTLVVTARDACGNVGRAERAYRIAENVNVDIQGAAEGALVAEARMSWAVVGRADCAGQIGSRLARNGAAAAAYAMNTLINQPGNYALTLDVPNCQGVVRQIIRNFSVNAPPVAVAVPNAHPQRDPAAVDVRGYVVAEGSGLQLDGSESQAPEVNDQIALYEWDFQGDGVYDAQGVLANFPTQDDGVFNGRLRVTDSLGAQATAPFRVTVTDVSPIAHAGGPYVIDQGRPLTVDGRASRPGSPADLITRYTWEWGDGTPAEQGPNLVQPTHTYAENGVYNLRLTVRDEDNEASVVVRVEVRDVDPVIRAITPPQDAYEIAGMRFEVDVTGGAPNDPITRIEWDFTGDGVPEYAGANLTSVTHVFEDAGEYTVTVRVRDKDSAATQGILVPVREITLAELVEVAQDRIAAVANDLDAPPIARARLRDIEPYLQNARWGERRGYRGNTWVALDQVLLQVVQSQNSGGRFGNLLWAMSRQMLREQRYLRRDLVAANGALAAHPSTGIADEILERMRQAYEAADFRAQVGDAQGFRARDLFADAYNAYFYLRDAAAPIGRFNQFTLPNIVNPVQRVAAANAVNADLNVALAELRTEMTEYLAAGGEQDPGPGRARISEGLELLRQIERLMQRPIGIICDEGQCISDRDALENELLLMDAVAKLYESARAGVYTRQWQHALMLAIKFRIELSILRVEFVCGPNMPVSVQARDQQRSGLTMVDRHEFDNALIYYIDPDTRCLLIRTYNECLVRADPANNPAEAFPEFCLDDQ